MTLNIGSVSIPDPVILAPMSGVTDLPFRNLVKSFGAGLVVSEMVASKSVIEVNKRTSKMLQLTQSSSPTAIQIMGRDPYLMGEAAKLCEGFGADIIDINFGCPARKVTSGAAGSALMREEKIASDILKTVVRSVQIPVTVKMRTGWDMANRNAPKLAQMAEDAGIQLVTVHGRTRCQFFKGSSDWLFINQIKAAVKIPVIGNGDILSIENARDFMQLAGCDGVMIGRGAQGRPWFLSQVMQFLKSGIILSEPSIISQLNIVYRHLDSILSYYGIERGIRKARKHINWYTSEFKNFSFYRKSLLQTEDRNNIKIALWDLFHLECENIESGQANR